MLIVLAIGVGVSGALQGLPSFAATVSPSAAPGAEVSRPWPDTVDKAAPAVNASAANAPMIAIVIDDMGIDAEQNHRLFALPAEISLAFLPYPEMTPSLALQARAAGHEILVHVPMQAPDDPDGSLKQALRRDLPAEENIRRLRAAMARVPGHIGINNHEGSVFTADRLALIPVVEALQGRGVFFLDSRTTPLTEIVPVARAFGVASSDRDVFLDDDPSPAAVERQLQLLEKTARSKGIAIAIGHPRQATVDAVTRWVATQQGFRLIPISAAIRLKTERDIGAARTAQDLRGKLR